MSDVKTILAFAGSTRPNSVNKRLLRISAAGARMAGATVTEIDFADYELPLHHGDVDSGMPMPAAARKLKSLVATHQGLLIAAPEHNSSLPAMLKNAIDWISWPDEGEVPLQSISGRVAAIMSASPLYLGGYRGLISLRSILSNMGVIVIPTMRTLPSADKAFAEDGSLRDTKTHKSFENLGSELVSFLHSYRSLSDA
jgi:chromate reductase, NAD(P)H dehydrogenase (quinone)